MEPQVSVVLPVWNGESHLAEAIESVLAQSYGSIELIVVDDGSTDRSAEIAGRYKGVRLHRQPNAGTASARNAGMALVRGRYVAHMDADDVWLPGKLALQAEALENDATLDAVTGLLVEFHSPDLSEQDRARLRAPRGPMPGHLLQAMLVRREAHERIGMFEERWQIAQDMDWYLKAMEAGFHLLVLPELVLRRRLHASNKGTTHRAHARQRLEILKAAIDRRRESP